MTSVSTPATDSRPRERKKERKKGNSANTRSYIRSPALVSFDLFCYCFSLFLSCRSSAFRAADHQQQQVIIIWRGRRDALDPLGSSTVKWWWWWWWSSWTWTDDRYLQLTHCAHSCLSVCYLFLLVFSQWALESTCEKLIISQQQQELFPWIIIRSFFSCWDLFTFIFLKKSCSKDSSLLRTWMKNKMMRFDGTT